jgi:hypothetical protein
MFTISSSSYQVLMGQPIAQLEAWARNLAKQCDVLLAYSRKSDLAKFICYYGMLP